MFTQPVTLAVTATSGGVEFQVVGLADAETAASYTLEVVSGSPPGGTRNVQSGSVRLKPTERATLLTTRLGGNARENWRARLTVKLESGRSYEVVKAAERTSPSAVPEPSLLRATVVDALGLEPRTR